MKKFFAPAFLLLLSAVNIWAAPSSAFSVPAVISGGDIRMHYEDSLSFIDPAYDDHTWETVPGVKVRDIRQKNGIRWYRMHFTVSGSVSEHPLALSLGRITDTDEVYLNGILIGSTGSFSQKNSHAFGLIRIYEIPLSLLNPGDNTLALRIKNSFSNPVEPFSSDFIIDRTEQLLQSYYLYDIPSVLLTVFFATSGFFMLFYFFRKRKNAEILLFGLLNISCALFFLTQLNNFEYIFGSFNAGKTSRYISMCAAFPLFLSSITYYFKRRHSALHFVYYFVSALCALLILIMPNPIAQDKMMSYMYIPSFIIPAAMSLYILAGELKDNIEARVIFCVTLLLTVFIFIDFLHYHRVFLIPGIDRNLQLTPYSAFLFIGITSFLFVRRSVRLGWQIQNKTRQLEKAVRERDIALRKIDISYMEAINRIAITAELRDPETDNHIRRVGYYALLIADEIGIGKEAAKNIFYAAPMHDAGKVGIPDTILFKDGALTTEEWGVMKTHTTIGARIFENAKSPVLITAREIALTHHEKYDGSGYPFGLKGNDIPLSGRIMAIADIYDAVRSKRPYKPEIPHERVIKIMTEGDDKIKPTDFDPLLLKVFTDKEKEFDQIYERYRD